MSKILKNLGNSKKRTLDSANEKTTKVEAANVRRAVKKPRKNSKGDMSIIDQKSCVVYLGHIAHGFYETELRSFFQQFGKVRRLKLFRSRKTGGSKGFAFIQFDSNDVAEVVASALDGYFLAERQLVCHVVPVNKIHDGMFLPPKQNADAEDADEEDANAEGTEKEPVVDMEKVVSRRTRRQRSKQEKLTSLGIDYTFMVTK